MESSNFKNRINEIFDEELDKNCNNRIRSAEVSRENIKKEFEEYKNFNFFQKIMFRVRKSELIESLPYELNFSFRLTVFSMFINLLLNIIKGKFTINFDSVFIFFMLLLTFLFLLNILFSYDIFFGNVRKSFFTDKIEDFDIKIRKLNDAKVLLKSDHKTTHESVTAPIVHGKTLLKFKTLLKDELSEKDFLSFSQEIEKARNFLDLKKALSIIK